MGFSLPISFNISLFFCNSSSLFYFKRNIITSLNFHSLSSSFLFTPLSHQVYHLRYIFICSLFFLFFSFSTAFLCTYSSLKRNSLLIRYNQIYPKFCPSFPSLSTPILNTNLFASFEVLDVSSSCH